MPDVSQLHIEATHKKISEVFSNKYAFSIPAYQRPYAWEKTHVEELLADLSEAMEPNPRSDGFYFLGSIVLVKKHGNSDSQVVDGQQRLTTLTILLSIIRDLTDDLETKINREKYIIQVANEDESIDERLRLQIRPKDQYYFKQYIQARGATNNLPSIDGLPDARARMIENAETMKTQLEKMTTEARNDLLKFILQNCYLVVVEVPTRNAAQRIFTVMNTRGMDLSATDILKANLLERAGQVNEDQLSRFWEDTEVSLGRDKFNDIFTHIRMIFERDKPRSALEDGFPRAVTSFNEDPINFVNTILDPYANAFALSLNDPELRNSFDVVTANLIRSLNRLDNKDWLPPLLLRLRQYDGGDQENISDFVFQLERLAYYLFMVRADVTTRISRYADVLDVLEPLTHSRPRVQRRELSTGLDITHDEAFALFDALDGPIYKSTRVVKPILLRLEQASVDASASYDYPIISVEHVCPQTIPEASEWAGWYSEEDHSRWLNRLGNLVLLNSRKNSAAQNFDLERKQSIYFTPGNSCAFTLTKEISNYQSWEPNQVGERQVELLKRLAKSWDLDDVFDNWLINKYSAD